MEKHKALVLGKKVRVHHYAASYSANIYTEEKLIEHVTIFDGEIENPILNVDDSIYIPEKKINVRVKVVSRNAGGGYVYFTDYIVEKIIDEDTEKSLVKAEKDLRAYMEKDKDNEIILEKQKEQDRYNKLNWFEKLTTKKPV